MRGDGCHLHEERHVLGSEWQTGLFLSGSVFAFQHCEEISEISPGKEEVVMVLWLHCHSGCSETEHHGGDGVGLPGGRSSSQLMAAGNHREMCSQYPTQGHVSHDLTFSSGAFFLSFAHLPTPPTQLGAKPLIVSPKPKLQ